MKVLILPGEQAATQRGAGIIAGRMRETPAAVLGLATGATMLPLYKALARRHRDDGLRFARTTGFIWTNIPACRRTIPVPIITTCATRSSIMSISTRRARTCRKETPPIRRRPHATTNV